MAGLCTIVYTMMLLTLYSVDVQANITLPSFGNITYVPKGSNVTLQWSYDFGAAIIGSTEWFFSNLGKPREFLAVIVGSTVTKSTSSSLTNINVITPATLVLINVSLDYNGTYRFKLSVISIDPAPFSEVLVVVLAQPTAVINGCPSPYTVEEGKDITCLCSGTGGNPPATASWWKNGMVVNGTGYLKKNLILKNISREDTGIYNCTVRSHNLTDATSVNITLRVKYKPTNISFSSNHSHNVVTSGKSVEIICKADAYPEATYSISYNGSLLTDAVNGSYTISSVNGSHGGNYTCVAKNAIGNVSAQFFLKVNARTTTTSSTQTMPTNTSKPTSAATTKSTEGTPTGEGDESSGDNIGLIAGAAGGGVVLLIILIVLIWYCFKRSANGSIKAGRREREEDIVANANYAAMADAGGNPYESVDAAKLEEARADEAGPSNENPSDAGNSMPPVYAVVDKSKKTPKPPPLEKKPDSVTYASLDPVLLQPDSSKMRARTREETNYASIDLEQLKKEGK